MKTRTKVFVGLGGLVVLGIIVSILAPSSGKNNAFQPQDEFRLKPWVNIKVGGLDMSINRAVFYLFLTAALTTWAMTYVAKRMQEKPNSVQTAVELAYDLARNNITRGNLQDPVMSARWFVFISTLFFFIWFANMIGYLPLPTNTAEHFHIFGLAIPTFAIYAATANISIPLVLTLVVWFSYNIEGVRKHGFIGYLKTFVPGGITGGAAIPLFVIEVVSHLVRIISLSVRLFANILAGHLLILFMAGGLVVLLGLPALGVFSVALLAIPFYIFEVGLVATLQAFIFATLTSIYLGGATAEGH